MGHSHLYPSWVRSKRPRKQQVMSPTDAHLPKGRSSTDTDLCLYNYCLSIYCRLCTHTHSLAPSTFQTNRVSFSLICSCIASLASCLSLSLMLLAFLPGPKLGVREKRSSEAPEISYFARPCCHIPTTGGSYFLGFTPAACLILLCLACPEMRPRLQKHPFSASNLANLTTEAVCFKFLA